MNLIQTFVSLLFGSVFAFATPKVEVGCLILSHDYDERVRAGIRYDASSRLIFDLPHHLSQARRKVELPGRVVSLPISPNLWPQR